MIYIVTSGQYSDYGIDGAFTTQAKAIAYCESVKDEWYNGDTIECWEGNTHVKNITVEKDGTLKFREC